jgi:class 3 adenylate cyclase/tetratricopeptide (TPR) repeat protein
MVTCAACGADNPAGHRFCGQCAAPLSVTCPACGAAAEAGQRFCGQCATPLGADPTRPAAQPAGGSLAAPVAERRVCSVLFADLVGFTPISEARDPEEVRELLSRYFEVARTVIARYGGVVEKFIGDAVMAVWGTPVAAEGDAERAVRAALDVVDGVAALGAETGIAQLAARAGVVTGEVAVTVGAQQEGMVAGDAVNTAARVQSAARPGTVLVDTTTRRLAAAAVSFDDAGTHTLKGKSEPEQLWQATHVIAGVGGNQRIDGLEAPLIGREAEMRLIKEMFHACADRRSARLVVVTGPAGVGKSRLGWEFEKYIDGLAQTMWWHRGRCLSYGEGVAFWALAQAIRQRLKIAEEDPTDVTSTKIINGVPTLITDPAERDFVAVRIGRLLGAPVAGDGGAPLAREELFAGWRMLFERMAATDPVIWLIEDAQHADAGLLDFVDHLIDWARDLPIFVLVLSRTEFAQDRPGFGVGRNRTLLALDPLDAASMGSLVESLVPGMPEPARAAITDHAQGVPLFAVETIRSLVDRDVVQPIDGVYRLVGEVGELTVPDSLHGLLAARLDALEPAVRTLVADAAVLGSSFPAEALVAVSDQDESAVRRGLDDLVRREVLAVSADRLSPERGSYHFAQELLRQVAYDTLSRRDRKARHLSVAAHLRASFADDGEEVSDVIARHYRDALAAVPDDPDVDTIRAEAIARSGRAGRRAARAGSPSAAADSLAAAATLATEAELPDAARWWEQAAEMADLASQYERAIDCAERAATLHEAAGKPRDAARARVVVGRALGQIGRMAEAREVLAAAVAVLRETPDSDTVDGMGNLIAMRAFANDPNATALAMEALDLAQALGVDQARMGRTFTFAGLAYGSTDRVGVAAAMFEYSARMAERAGDRFGQARALCNVCNVVSSVDPAYGGVAARQALEIGRTIGAPRLVALSAANLMDTMLTLGEWDSAQALLEELTAGGLGLQLYFSGFSAIVGGLRGDADSARAASEQVNESQDSEDPQDLALIALVHAVVAHAEGDQVETLRHALQAVSFSAALGIRQDSVRWAWALAARAARSVGDTDALADLVRLIDQHPIGHLPPVLRAEAELARIDLGAVAQDAVDDTYQLAIRILRDLPAPYNLGWALVQRGRDTDLIEAAEIAERLGALPLAREAAARSAQPA